jgi:hypothetical protein
VLARVEVHNRLNGYAFVIAEFVLIGAVVAGYGVYYSRHGRPLEGVLALGIVANAAVIVLLCVRSVLRGERGVGLWRIYTDSEVRRKVMEENPRLSTDSLLITGLVLLPFVLLVLALWAALHPSQRGRHA